MLLVSGYAAVPAYLPREKVGWGLGIMTTAAAVGVFMGPMETVYSEYAAPAEGFTTAFGAGGLACLAAWCLLWRSQPKQGGAGTGADIKE